jgi:hypothetical protein
MLCEGKRTGSVVLIDCAKDSLEPVGPSPGVKSMGLSFSLNRFEGENLSLRTILNASSRRSGFRKRKTKK